MLAKAALPVMLRPLAADARDVERAARDDRIMIRCAAGAEGEFRTLHLFRFSSIEFEPRAAERVFGPAFVTTYVFL